MADPQSTAAATTARIVRLPGIELDLGAHRLLVDGRQRACSRRAMALLQLLCERPGRVWPRAELLDALWPGGQVVADESLSQLVFRLRAALGPRGDCIVTVRGVGVRLDPPDEACGPPPEPQPSVALRDVHEAGPPAPPRQAPATPAAPAATPPRADRAGAGRRPPWRHLAALLLVVLALALAWRQLAAPVAAGRWLDIGMGVQAGDLGGAPGAAVDLVAEAFAQDRLGDRARARALMEAAHDAAPASPLPALILALWTSGIGDGSVAGAWLERAAQRRSEGNAYLTMLENYVRAEQAGRPLDSARHAGAVLDVRPRAWFMRLARAHLYGAKGLRERALEELRGIDDADLDHPRLAMAVADRAAYGDPAGARALLAGRDPASDTPDLSLARARIDWSSGELDAARARLADTARLARSQARLDIHDRALAYAGLIELLDDRPADALPLLERARAGAGDRRATGLELDLTLVIAHACAALERPDDVAVELARAAELARAQPSTAMGYFTRLVALRLAPGLERVDLPDSDEPGAASLIAARRALLAGDAGQARAMAERAVAQGALEAWLAEETRLLLAELGLAVPEAPPLHPPHPPLTRFVTRHLIEARLDAAPRR